MRARLLTQGNDGEQHYEAGAEYVGSSEWIRRMLVNGLAEPLDDVAKAVVDNPERHPELISGALRAEAQVLKTDDA